MLTTYGKHDDLGEAIAKAVADVASKVSCVVRPHGPYLEASVRCHVVSVANADRFEVFVILKRRGKT